MKKLISIFLFLSTKIIFSQIIYTLPYQDTVLNFSNWANVAYSLAIPTKTNISVISNSLVSECNFYTFAMEKISTNIIYNHQNIIYKIFPVDGAGKHVTLTNLTNIKLTFSRPSGSILPGELRITNLTFISPTVPIPDEYGFLDPFKTLQPDMTGMLFTNSFSSAAYLELIPNTKTTFTNYIPSTPHPISKEITYSPQIITNSDAKYLSNEFRFTHANNNYFQIYEMEIKVQSFFTNKHRQKLKVYLMSENTNGVLTLTEEISSEFKYTNHNQENISFSLTNGEYILRGLNEGYAILTLQNTNSIRNLPPTNLIFRIALHKNSSKRFLPVNFVNVNDHTIDVVKDTFSQNIVLDVRTPDELLNETEIASSAPIKNGSFIKAKRGPTLSPEIGLSSATTQAKNENIYFFPNTIIQTGAFDSNQISITPLKEVQLKLRYDPSTLSIPEGFIYKETSLKVYKYNAGKWSELAESISIDTTTKEVLFNVMEFGTYGIGASIMKEIIDVTRVFPYPNPYRIENNNKLKFINIPPNFSYMAIYTLSGRVIKTFQPSELAIGNIEGFIDGYYIEWDGKNSDGDVLPGGIYYYKIEKEGLEQIDKFVIIN